MNILMVCLGNICRSPLAHGILEHKIRERNLAWKVDSAGTSGWHNGEPPDMRSIQQAAKFNIDIQNQRSRQIILEDLEEFDLILVMDSSNYQNVMALATNKIQENKIKLILNYVTPAQNRAVPDPYYDGGFQLVYDLLDEATDRLIEHHSTTD